MELIYLIVFVGVFSSAICSDLVTCDTDNVVRLKVYEAYLIGFTMFFMLIIIAGLSVALYMVINNKSIFGITITRKPTYIRQESAPGVTLCNVSTNNNLNDQCKNDGSTLTVNSGVVEIGCSYVEPETPTRTDENTSLPVKSKMPSKSAIPTIQKAQMDNIIREVLNRKQKSDSATFRELDALSNPGSGTLYENNFLKMSKKNNSSLNHVDEPENENGSGGEIYENASSIIKMKNELKETKPKRELKNKVTNVPKAVSQKDLVDSSRNPPPNVIENLDEDEQEVYDTVPNPVRCKESSAEVDDYVETLHVYDLPPKRKSWEMNDNTNRNIIMDQDTQYLLPISGNLTEDQERSCYINAKLPDSH